MKKKIILTGCFLVFSLSSLVMVLISMEEKRDLSGRAASSQKMIVPENLRREYRGELWTGKGKSLYYNANSWERDGDSFWNRDGNFMIKIVSATNNIGSLMSKDQQMMSVGEEIEKGGWKMKEFEYNFLNRNKKGEYWGKGEIGLLVLGNESIDRETVNSFVEGFGEENKVQGVISYDVEEKTVEMSKPSVVKVATKMCDQIRVVDGYLMLNGKSYDFCMVGTGSGFFVSGEGYIATNGHVIRFASYEEKIVAAVLAGGLNDFVSDAVRMQLSILGIDANSLEATDYVSKVLASRGEMLRYASFFIADHEDGFLSMGESVYEYVIGLGKTPIEVDENSNFNKSSDIRVADLVGYDYEEMNDDGSFKSSDVAILKIEGSGYPALPLGNVDDLPQGSKIQVIGFPGIVSGGKNSFLNESMEVTVTGGMVSSIKTAKGDNKRLIQTDASITHGNSGGPAMDGQGNVIGIATYAIVLGEGGGNYNFLRDIADIKVLANKLGVELGANDTYTKWREGLNNYWRSYYRYARNDFDDVKKNYYDHLLVGKYLTEIDGLVGGKNDLTPKFNKTQRDVIRMVCGVLMASSAIVGLGVMIFGKKNQPILSV